MVRSIQNGLLISCKENHLYIFCSKTNAGFSSAKEIGIDFPAPNSRNVRALEAAGEKICIARLT